MPVVGVGMGPALQAHDRTLDDLGRLEGCGEILTETRPDVVSAIHRGRPEAGSDATGADMFGTDLAKPGECDIVDLIRDRASPLGGHGLVQLTGSWPSTGAAGSGRS
ncbi:hypothetical protein [Prauserella alba]|uniref:hypothetical protein n=1 Tax=Prauserella alba TaxID=176898 RepID=UPI0020A3E861|nr:hypothetical protein [Prauserella alba]